MFTDDLIPGVPKKHYCATNDEIINLCAMNGMQAWSRGEGEDDESTCVSKDDVSNSCAAISPELKVTWLGYGEPNAVSSCQSKADVPKFCAAQDPPQKAFNPQGPNTSVDEQADYYCGDIDGFAWYCGTIGARLWLTGTQGVDEFAYCVPEGEVLAGCKSKAVMSFLKDPWWLESEMNYYYCSEEITPFAQYCATADPYFHGMAYYT